MMISMALVLAMGCGKKGTPKPQGQAKAPSKPTVPDSKKGQPKTGPKAETQKPGTVLWEFETGDGVSCFSPAIGSDGTVYVGSGDYKVYAIKTESKGLAKSPWPMRGQNALHTGRVMKK